MQTGVSAEERGEFTVSSGKGLICPGGNTRSVTPIIMRAISQGRGQSGVTLVGRGGGA